MVMAVKMEIKLYFDLSMVENKIWSTWKSEQKIKTRNRTPC